MTCASFSTRHPGESEPLGFDFTARLASGETVDSGTVTAAVVDGTDPDVGTLFTGAASINAGIILRRMEGGVDGVTYKITASVVTSLGNTLIACATVRVEDC